MRNEVLKERVTLAFSELRSQGFIAKQAFMCCRSCAGYAIAEQVKAMTSARRAKLKGAVTYCKQDAEIFQESRRWRPQENPVLYIGYGPVELHGIGEFGLCSKECGEALRAALEGAQLEVIWDGDPATRIACRVPAPTPLAQEGL